MAILLIKTYIDIDITSIILKKRATRHLLRFYATKGPLSHCGRVSVLFLELLVQEFFGPFLAVVLHIMFLFPFGPLAYFSIQDIRFPTSVLCTFR